ncbi:cytochrome P450 [Coniophora puteana RWD-64-598 SS2]|uniref:Cytochrome P450 n=1 Tax=Coniophora puteana (strain RWD-64-598) TaxID=741705 RepID=A0A5M3N3S7_CONPW|nr:cytochrome P450 [Coniophora puteana RWD-64-598 SS2]EIW86006.1 cytochrome P450 [Coniophora puteana RWD-64-598 SS2]
MATAIVISVLAICTIAKWVRDKGSRLPLPPGPTGFPIVGNTLHINTEKPHLTFSNWRSRYDVTRGDIIYCKIWGQDTIIVCSEKIARDLLDKRSSNYSDKSLVAESRAYNLDFNTGWIPYSDKWRLHRRIYHQALRQEIVPKYRPMQLRQAHKLLEDLLDRPDAFEVHLQAYASPIIHGVLIWMLKFLYIRHAAAIIMSVIYGYETRSHNDQMVSVIEKANDFIIPFGTPPAMGLIKAFPFLLKIPTWFPGGWIRQAVISGKKHVDTMLELPYQYVKQSLASGTAPASMVGDMLQRAEAQVVPEVYEECVRNTAGAAFSGANVLIDTWEIHHDASRFPEPHLFKPERYLNGDGSLTDDMSHMMVFGLGRRVCPGRHLALASVWSAMTCMLAAFTFEKARDSDGSEIEINPRWTIGLTRSKDCKGAVVKIGCPKHARRKRSQRHLATDFKPFLLSQSLDRRLRAVFSYVLLADIRWIDFQEEPDIAGQESEELRNPQRGDLTYQKNSEGLIP